MLTKLILLFSTLLSINALSSYNSNGFLAEHHQKNSHQYQFFIRHNQKSEKSVELKGDGKVDSEREKEEKGSILNDAHKPLLVFNKHLALPNPNIPTLLEITEIPVLDKVKENSLDKVKENSLDKIKENSFDKVKENSLDKVKDNSLDKVKENQEILLDKDKENSLDKVKDNSLDKVKENSLNESIELEENPLDQLNLNELTIESKKLDVDYWKVKQAVNDTLKKYKQYVNLETLSADIKIYYQNDIQLYSAVHFRAVLAQCNEFVCTKESAKNVSVYEGSVFYDHQLIVDGFPKHKILNLLPVN